MKVAVKIFYVKLLAVVLLVGGLCACVSLKAFQKSSLDAARNSAAAAEPSGSELIAGYKEWTRVNPVPAVFHSQLAAQCAPVTARQIEFENSNPHRDKFITVYVNDIGKHAMLEEKSPRFPQGSIIVKEKLTSPESTKPELLTVMIKREAGFNPKNGDWEYMATDGAGKEVQERGKLESCQACHSLYEKTDYVSRFYMPTERWQKLK